MHPFLIRLGVPLAVQTFFQPYWQTDAAGSLLFNYQDSMEHYGMAYHKVPTSNHYWTAGDPLLSRELLITGSAMEAIAYLALHQHRYAAITDLLFLATGSRLNTQQFNCIRQHLKGKSCTLVFENSLLGQLTDLKMAAGIKRIPVTVFAESANRLLVHFRMNNHHFDSTQFSLSQFEKVSGFRFGLRTAKPRKELSWLTRLKSLKN